MTKFRLRLASLPTASITRAAAICLLLAGCGTTAPPGIDLGDYQAAPRDLVHVTSQTYDHLVRVGRAGRIDLLERERLDAFVAHVGANRPESLRVALRGRGTRAQYRAVSDVLMAAGVDPRGITQVDATAGPPVPSGTLAVEVERAISVLPDCPGWVDHVSAPEDNRTSPNFGCADVSNFAAMVGDPHHLITGASSIYEDGERGATAVANYKADKVKELPAVNESFRIIPSGR